MDFKALVGKTVGWAGEVPEDINDPETKSVYLFFTDMSALFIPAPELGAPPSLVPNAQAVIDDILRQHKPAAEKIMALEGFVDVMKLAEEIRQNNVAQKATEQYRASLGKGGAPEGELQGVTKEPEVIEMPLPDSMVAALPDPEAP